MYSSAGSSISITILAMNKLHGRTPLQMWAAGVEQYGCAPAPDIVDRRRVFGTTLTRKLQSTGLLVLGVRYHSAELHMPELKKKSGQVELRWHPENIGAIAVKRDSGWLEVGAVMDEFHGRRAEDWLEVVARLRADRATTEEANRAVIREAFDFIDRINAAAMKRANIKIEDWSDRRIDAEEARIFSVWRVADDPAAPPETVGDGLIAQSFQVGGVAPPIFTETSSRNDPKLLIDNDADDDVQDWEIRK